MMQVGYYLLDRPGAPPASVADIDATVKKLLAAALDQVAFFVPFLCTYCALDQVAFLATLYMDLRVPQVFHGGSGLRRMPDRALS